MDDAAREARAALGDRVAGRRDEHGILAGRWVERRLREREDDLLGPQQRQHLGIGIDVGAEPAADPARNGFAKLRQPRSPRV